MGQFSAVEASEGPSTTIVGAQPPRRQRKQVNVPAGVEKILYLAATDRRFHQALLQDRAAAVAASGIELKASELAMLRAAPAAQLEATIAALDVTPENLGRRRFMQAVAVSAVTLAAADALSGCGDDDGKVPADSSTFFDSGGIRPDAGTDTATDITTDTSGGSPDAGISADMPSGFDSGGIRPGG